MRLDVRDNLRRAARWEFVTHKNCVVLVDAGFVEDWTAEWSEPVQLRVLSNDDGLVELALRRIDDCSELLRQKGVEG